MAKSSKKGGKGKQKREESDASLFGGKKVTAVKKVTAQRQKSHANTKKATQATKKATQDEKVEGWGGMGARRCADESGEPTRADRVEWGGPVGMGGEW